MGVAGVTKSELDTLKCSYVQLNPNRTGTELEQNWNRTGTELEQNPNRTGTGVVHTPFHKLK